MKFSTNPKGVQVNVILANRKEGTAAMDVRSLLANLDPLKLLVEYDDSSQTYVAHCLDTGAVATGNSLEEAQKLIQDVLENDILIAIRTNSLASLFNTSAPADVRTRWFEARADSPESVTTIELKIPSDPDGVPPKRGVQTELRVGKTKQISVA
jgi:hypothetical protein